MHAQIVAEISFIDLKYGMFGNCFSLGTALMPVACQYTGDHFNYPSVCQSVSPPASMRLHPSLSVRYEVITEKKFSTYKLHTAYADGGNRR